MRLPNRAPPAKPEKGRFATTDVVKVGLIAAFASVLAAALTLFSSLLSTEQLREQHCIARIDSQESKLRDKAAELQGNIAGLIAVASAPDLDRLKYHTAVEKVMRSAYEMTAYTGATELGLQALLIAQAVHRGLSITTEEQREQAIQLNGKTFHDWPLLYSLILDDYEKKRTGCAGPLTSRVIDLTAQKPTAPAS